MEIGLGELKPSNIAFKDPVMSRNLKDLLTHSQLSPESRLFCAKH